MAQAARQYDQGDEPANDNYAPKPRLVVDNTKPNTTTAKPVPIRTGKNQTRTARRPHQPISYKGHLLRYKTPREWEEFGRLNPHIDPEFWDSPIISQDKTDFTNSPIVTNQSPYEKLKGRLGRTRNAKPVYGYNDDQGQPPSDVEFAKQHTEQSLLKRKETAKLRKLVKEEEKEKKRVAADIKQDLNYYERTMYQTGQRTGRVVGVATRQKYKIATYITKYIIMGWFFTGQLALFGLALILIVSGTFMLAGTSATSGILGSVSEAGGWIRFIPFFGPLIGLAGGVISTVGDSLPLVSLPFLGGGFGVAFFNFLLSVMLMGVVMLIFAITGMKSMSSETGKGTMKKILFGAAIIGYFVPFTQFVPWAYFWVKYVGNNPE